MKALELIIFSQVNNATARNNKKNYVYGQIKSDNVSANSPKIQQDVSAFPFLVSPLRNNGSQVQNY